MQAYMISQKYRFVHETLVEYGPISLQLGSNFKLRKNNKNLFI